MAIFDVTHKILGGNSNAKAYIADEEYGQIVEFDVSGLSFTDKLTVSKIALSTDPLGTNVIATITPGSTSLSPLSTSDMWAAVKASDLKGVSTIYATAYDTDGAWCGSASTAINVTELPAWLKDSNTEFDYKDVVYDASGNITVSATDTIREFTEINWFEKGINIGDQVYDISAWNPKFALTVDYDVNFDGQTWACVDSSVKGNFNRKGLFYDGDITSDFFKNAIHLFAQGNSTSNKKYTQEVGQAAGVDLSFAVSYYNPITSAANFSGTFTPNYSISWSRSYPPVGWWSFDLAAELKLAFPIVISINSDTVSEDLDLSVGFELGGEAKIGGSLGNIDFGDLGLSVKLLSGGVYFNAKGEGSFELTEGDGTAPELSLNAGIYIDALTLKFGQEGNSKIKGLDFTGWGFTKNFFSLSTGNQADISVNKAVQCFTNQEFKWLDDSSAEITIDVTGLYNKALDGMNHQLFITYAEIDKSGHVIGTVESTTMTKSLSTSSGNSTKYQGYLSGVDSSKRYAYSFSLTPQDEDAKSSMCSASEKFYGTSQVYESTGVITIENITITEPSGTNMSTLKEATFTAKLSTASDEEVTFYWFTEDGTAIDQEDYLGVQDGVVTFAPGETEKTFTVQVIGDGQKEDEEAFFVNLTAGDNAYFSLTNAIGDDNTRGYAECVIQDSDYKGAAVVTVVDCSGSMSGSRMSSAKSAACTAIDNMRTGDYIGVVGFTTSASTYYQLTQINDDSVKTSAKSAVSGMRASGGTFIGSGISRAASMLSGVDSTSKTIIIMTDGEDNWGYESQTKNIIANLPKDQELQRGYNIYGIGYGTQSSAAVDALSVAVDSDVQLSTSYSSKTYMEELMDLCGGKYYYAADADDLAEIYFDLSTRSSNQQLITKKSDSVEADTFTVESVVVDSGCTAVRFGINWTNGDLDLVLWDPNGHYYDSTTVSENIRFVSNGTSEYYEVTAPAKGVWGLGVNAQAVSGTEEAFDYYAIATSNISADLNFDDTRAAVNQQIAMTCTVTNGDSSVLNASVYARVQDTAGNTSYVDLYDDGLHSDGMANDGVYGNVITETTAGVYKVTAYAEGTSTMGDTFYRQTVEEQFQVDVNAKASAISIHGDFNGDGLADIVQYDYAKSKNVTAWYAQEDGSMKWGYVNNAASDWTISSMTGDFTGNGSDDIMWINESSGHIGTWQTDGGTTKWSILTITDFDEWSLQGIGDFNGDGTDDMLFRNRLNNLVGTLDVENGEQKVGSWKVINGTTDAWQIAGTGDFNGDKVDDILLTNTVSGQVGIWNMSRSGYSSWTSLSFTDFAEWRIKGIADFNGDGTDDILFENEKTGVVGSWNISNGAIKEWSLIGIADVSSDWKISGVGDFNGDQVAEIAWTNLNSDRIGCWTQDKENLAQWSILA